MSGTSTTNRSKTAPSPTPNQDHDVVNSASTKLHPPHRESVKDAKLRQRDARKARQRRGDQRLDRAERMSHGVNWPITMWLIISHAGLLAAPFTFTWQGLVTAVVLHWLTGGIGICLGYHRLLTHAGFQTYRPVKYLLAFIGGLAGEGSAIDWVANHRKHHALSDQDGDPHSPRDGKWWSHAYWICYDIAHGQEQKYKMQWAPDLAKDRGMQIIGKMFIPSHFLLAAVLFSVGYYFGGTALGCSLFVWGSFVRLAAVLHSTWFVNSATHIFGYRNYETTDDSGNVWWVAALTYGEGWHNNHHAYPRMAMHGHKWWEFDLTYRTIQLMQLCGVAWDVVNYRHRNEKAA